MIDKDSGMTSHDVVASLRRIFAQKRAGHAGTLDPDATGILIVGFGRFTRALKYFVGLQKTYIADFVLGVSTDTMDSSGVEIARSNPRKVSDDDIEEAIKALTGEIIQVPPMISAIKVGGKKLYEYAREGKEVEIPPRKVNVYSFEFTRSNIENELRVKISCSAGTYIRSLANDLGEALEVGCHLKNLRRVEIGSFGVQQSVSIKDVTLNHFLTPASALSFMHQVTVSEEVEAKISHGSPLSRVETGALGEGPFAMINSNGDLLAVYKSAGLEKITPDVVVAATG